MVHSDVLERKAEQPVSSPGFYQEPILHSTLFRVPRCPQNGENMISGVLGSLGT